MFDNNDKQSTHGSETDGSRRRFLLGSAGALGGLALGVQPAFASGDGDEDTEQMAEMFEDDVAILNYALTLEYLEAAFYQRALNNVDEMMTDRVEKLPEAVRERIYKELSIIQQHEETHVEFLTDTIEELGGEPVEEPEFDFGEAVEDPQTFIETAAVLEDTGVAAYAGAAPSIENPELVPPALSIHSVEARHASFVRELGGEIGFPNAFDEPLPKEEVLDAVSPFIVEETSEDDETEDDEADDSDTAEEHSEHDH